MHYIGAVAAANRFGSGFFVHTLMFPVRPIVLATLFGVTLTPLPAAAHASSSHAAPGRTSVHQRVDVSLGLPEPGIRAVESHSDDDSVVNDPCRLLAVPIDVAGERLVASRAAHCSMSVHRSQSVDRRPISRGPPLLI